MEIQKLGRMWRVVENSLGSDDTRKFTSFQYLPQRGFHTGFTMLESSEKEKEEEDEKKEEGTERFPDRFHAPRFSGPGGPAPGIPL